VSKLVLCVQIVNVRCSGLSTNIIKPAIIIIVVVVTRPITFWLIISRYSIINAYRLH